MNAEILFVIAYSFVSSVVSDEGGSSTASVVTASVGASATGA